MLKYAVFYLLFIGFFIFGIFGIDATWHKWHLHQSVAGDFESSVYWVLMLICGFGAWIVSKYLRPRRNRYVAWRE